MLLYELRISIQTRSKTVRERFENNNRILYKNKWECRKYNIVYETRYEKRILRRTENTEKSWYLLCSLEAENNSSSPGSKRKIAIEKSYSRHAQRTIDFKNVITMERKKSMLITKGRDRVIYGCL